MLPLYKEGSVGLLNIPQSFMLSRVILFSPVLLFSFFPFPFFFFFYFFAPRQISMPISK